jgi:hypothetical protein
LFNSWRNGSLRVDAVGREPLWSPVYHPRWSRLKFWRFRYTRGGRMREMGLCSAKGRTYGSRRQARERSSCIARGPQPTGRAGRAATQANADGPLSAQAKGDEALGNIFCQKKLRCDDRTLPSPRLAGQFNAPRERPPRSQRRRRVCYGGTLATRSLRALICRWSNRSAFSSGIADGTIATAYIPSPVTPWQLHCAAYYLPITYYITYYLPIIHTPS